MALHTKFVKDIGIIGIAQLLTNFKGFILIPLLTKSLGPQNYGIWAQFFITINFIAPLIALSLPNALIRFLPGTKEKKDAQEQIWSTNLLVFILALFVAAGLMIFASQISNILKIPSGLILLLGILVIFESLSSLLSSVFQAFRETKKLFAFIVLSPIAEIVFVSFAVLGNHGLYGAVFALLFAKLLILFLLLFLVIQKVGLGIPNFSRIKEYLSFSLPTMAGGFSYRVVQVGDQYIIGAFMGIIFVGYYAPAYSLGLMLNMLTLPIGMILPALLAKLFSENNSEEIKKYLGETMKYILLLIIPAAFGISVLSRQLLEILSTREIALHAYMVVPFVAASFLLFAAQGIFVQILYLFKKTREVGTIWFLGALINVGANFILIPRLGLLGAAIATLLAYLFVFASTWFFSSKYLQFNIEHKPLLKSITAAFLMSAIIFLSHPEGLLETGASIVLGAVFYGFLLFAFRAIGEKEIKFFAKLF